MSLRTTLKNGLKAAVEAAIAAAALTVPVEKWSGEEAVFNDSHAWPGISVTSAGIEFGEPEEIREDDGATYQRGHVFRVFTYAAHVPNGTDGDDTCDAINDVIEDGVAGHLISGLGKAEIIGEEQVAAHMGRFLYVQTWKIELLESH
ncbi:MAG: hypothetical protein WCZ86_05835 [Desulfurivibrionaceae bacterium]|jgi:hypothetical protein